MKKIKLALVAIGVASAGLFSFTVLETGSIKGVVTPAEGASAVWAISGKDTLKSDIQNGGFEITYARCGTYTLVVEAKPPYKNQAKENVTVAAGQVTELGEIKLEP